jgi:hypothetical protein
MEVRLREANKQRLKAIQVQALRPLLGFTIFGCQKNRDVMEKITSSSHSKATLSRNLEKYRNNAEKY